MSRAEASRALEGALALAAAMGIGRFAYTALLPPTQVALGIGDDVAGALASGNLVGYLAGVLVARHLAADPRRGSALRLGLAMTFLATALGAASTSPVVWAALRFAAGVASGLVFVLASGATLEVAARHAGLLFSGPGIGIAISGAVAALAPSRFALPWAILGAAAGALALPAWRHLAAGPRGAAAGGAASPPPSRPEIGFGRLAAAYFLEGLGYIVSGTFAVAAVRRTPGLEWLAPWTWVLTGLAAAPSAVLWAALGRRLGVRRALCVAHLVQAVGMAIGAVAATAGAALVGAALFGGTFIGITTLAMAAGRSLAPEAPGRVVGTLTAAYGVGQVLGPVLAGALSDRLGNPRPAVLGAAAAVAIGGALLAVAPRRGRAHRSPTPP